MGQMNTTTAFQALADAEAAGLRVSFDGVRVRVSGPKTAGAIAKAVLALRDDVKGELQLRSLGCGKNAPDSVLGRLERNLLKWLNGEMVQADEFKPLDIGRMAAQILRAIAALPHGDLDPNGELAAMVKVFKMLTERRQWSYRSAEYDWPGEESPISTTELKSLAEEAVKEKPGKVETKKKYQRFKPDDGMARALSAREDDGDVPF